MTFDKIYQYNFPTTIPYPRSVSSQTEIDQSPNVVCEDTDQGFRTQTKDLYN